MRKRTAYIRQYIQDHLDKTNAELADDLQMEKGSVRYHIRALKLQGVRKTLGYYPRTPHDEYIREHYPNKSASLIAKEVGMTPGGVRCAAYRLGIKHNPGYARVQCSHRQIGENLTGQRFGYLVVKRQLGTNKYGQMRYECLCDCGKMTESTAGNLKHGHKKSCGCYRRQLAGFKRKKR